MPAPRKYPEELRQRAIRMTLDARKDPVSRPGACARIGDQLGINPDTLRGWVTQAEVDAGGRPGTTTSDRSRTAARDRERARRSPLQHLCTAADARQPRLGPHRPIRQLLQPGHSLTARWHVLPRCRPVCAGRSAGVDPAQRGSRRNRAHGAARWHRGGLPGHSGVTPIPARQLTGGSPPARPRNVVGQGDPR